MSAEDTNRYDVIVVGAGVSGLRCAGLLSEQGREVLVLERSAAPGGRCASANISGHVADFGPLFAHGHNEEFLDSIEDSVGPDLIRGWPFRIDGSGTPCQPDAFTPGETRYALRAGMQTFPIALARDLDVRYGSQVDAIEAPSGHGGVVTLTTTDGERFCCHDLVIALALEQSIELLKSVSLGRLAGSREIDGAVALCSLFASIPSLTVIALYDGDAPRPAWDVSYPEADEALLLAGNEGEKHRMSGYNVIVYQAHASWSRHWFERDRKDWERTLLRHAANRYGTWAGTPIETRLHRWRYGRLDRASELVAPVLIELEGCRIGVTGDLFAPGGGVQAAWEAGAHMAGFL